MERNRFKKCDAEAEMCAMLSGVLVLHSEIGKLCPDLMINVAPIRIIRLEAESEVKKHDPRSG